MLGTDAEAHPKGDEGIFSLASCLAGAVCHSRSAASSDQPVADRNSESAASGPAYVADHRHGYTERMFIRYTTLDTRIASTR